MEVTKVTVNTQEGLNGLVLTLLRDGWNGIYNEANCIIFRKNNKVKVIALNF